MRDFFKKISKNVKQFLFGWIVFEAVGLISVLNYSKSTIHFTINSFNNQFGDVFFKYYTHVADGLTVVIIALLLGFKKIRLTIGSLIALIVASAVTQILKRQVFSDFARPSKFFEGEALHFVEGVTLHCCHSFPSGHTTAGFVLFFWLNVAIDKSRWALILLFMAIGIGYSRVYLSQHHFEDIVAGAAVGTVFSLVVYSLMNQWKKPWLDKSFLELRSKSAE